MIRGMKGTCIQLTTRKKAVIITICLILLSALYFGVGIMRSLYLESTPIALVLPSRFGVTGTVRIAQLSDLHMAVFGEKNQLLVDLVASKAPDLIVTSGDMLDARAESIDDLIDLYKRLVKIAPVVYSLGNHEMSRGANDVYALFTALSKIGVQCVNNSAVTIPVNGMRLRVGGLYNAELYPALEKGGPIDILLLHFPEKFPLLAEYGVPLTFSGHTHGGQFRIPFFNIATYAPGQGLFPRYTKGLYTSGESHMIVSRGLGNSSFPIRVFNPPEVVIADVTYASAL